MVELSEPAGCSVWDRATGRDEGRRSDRREKQRSFFRFSMQCHKFFKCTRLIPRMSFKAGGFELSKPLFEVVEVRPVNSKPRLAAHVTRPPSLVESSLALEAGQAGQAGQACAQRLALVPQLPAVSQSDPALGHPGTPGKVTELESRSNAPPTHDQGSSSSTLLDRHGDASRERSRTPEKVKPAVLPRNIFHE